MNINEKIAILEKFNYHNEALLYLCQNILHNNYLTSIMEHVIELHTILGYMPQTLKAFVDTNVCQVLRDTMQCYNANEQKAIKSII